MFEAFVLLTSPVWATTLVYFLFSPSKKQAQRYQQQKLREEAIKQAGRDAVRRGYERGQ